MSQSVDQSATEPLARFSKTDNLARVFVFDAQHTASFRRRPWQIRWQTQRNINALRGESHPPTPIVPPTAWPREHGKVNKTHSRNQRSAKSGSNLDHRHAPHR